MHMALHELLIFFLRHPALNIFIVPFHTKRLKNFHTVGLNFENKFGKILVKIPFGYDNIYFKYRSIGFYFSTQPFNLR